MKPMLASKVDDVNDISFPVYASPKLDGIRCLIINGMAVSRNLKPIPNKGVSEMLRGLPAMDGELICGLPTDKDVFQKTSSGVMSREGVPVFLYHVFDALTTAPMQFSQRLDLARRYVASCTDMRVTLVPHKLIKTVEGLLAFEEECLKLGYEGVMIRAPDGPYKHGRSTTREGWLLKLKRFEDSEAEVLGFVEKEHNDNERTTDELGRSKRSSHKANKRAAGTLGALIVKDAETGVQFNIGSGFNEAQRADIWKRRNDAGSLLGKLVKYRYQPTGVKDAPRFPVFLGVRDEADT